MVKVNGLNSLILTYISEGGENMDISFNTKKYELKDSLNVSIDRLQASLVRAGNSVDELLLELENIQKVTIQNEEEVIKTYKKYTKPLAVAIYEDVISVELLNEALLQEMEEE